LTDTSLKNIINDGIYGNNFYLKILKHDDISENYLSWLRDPDICRYLESRFSSHTLDSLRLNLAQFDSKTKFFFGLFDSNLNTHVGNFNIHFNRSHQTAYYGYLIGDKTYWGKSAALLGTYLTLKFSFDFLNARKVWGSIYLDNIAAIINVKKFGFIEEGRQKNQYIIDGKPTDCILFGLERDKWLLHKEKFSLLYE